MHANKIFCYFCTESVQLPDVLNHIEEFHIGFQIKDSPYLLSCGRCGYEVTVEGRAKIMEHCYRMRHPPSEVHLNWSDYITRETKRIRTLIGSGVELLHKNSWEQGTRPIDNPLPQKRRRESTNYEEIPSDDELGPEEEPTVSRRQRFAGYNESIHETRMAFKSKYQVEDPENAAHHNEHYPTQSSNGLSNQSIMEEDDESDIATIVEDDETENDLCTEQNKSQLAVSYLPQAVRPARINHESAEINEEKNAMSEDEMLPSIQTPAEHVRQSLENLQDPQIKSEIGDADNSSVSSELPGYIEPKGPEEDVETEFPSPVEEDSKPLKIDEKPEYISKVLTFKPDANDTKIGADNLHHQCKTCMRIISSGKKGLSRRALLLHVTSHTRLKLIRCNDCRAELTTHHNFDTHKKQKGCSGKWTGLMTEEKRNILRNQLAECFPDIDFDSHLRDSSSVGNNLEKLRSRQEAAGKWDCAKCSRNGCRKRSSAVKHAVVHSGLKPYACKNCLVSFNRFQTVQAHGRAKTLKPKGCNGEFETKTTAKDIEKILETLDQCFPEAEWRKELPPGTKSAEIQF